jgi:bile acid-coenzyme A ligase
LAAELAGLLQANGQPVDGAPLGAILSAHAAITPSAPALTIGDRTLTFAELDARANRRARHLQAFGLSAGDRAIIALPNRAEFIEATYALWKLGAIPCPASHQMTPAEFESYASLVEPQCIVTQAGCVQASAPFYDVDAPMPDAIASHPLPVAVSNPGRIISSGGSTGRPKLIIDPKPSLWGPDKEGRNRGPRITLLNAGPFYHAAPFAYSTWSMAQGSHVVCLERFDAEKWLHEVEKYRPRYVYLVPTMMSRIAKLPDAVTRSVDLSCIETLLHMAAPCPPEVKRWWLERLAPERVLEVYGGSERVGATIINGREWLQHPGSVGKASPGEEIVILGESGHSLANGEIGEIYFRRQTPPGGSYAYIGSETRARGDLDSFGDMGWLDGDGYLYIADRRTDMVVIGGANVFPAEIEAAIEMLPGVMGSAVIGLPDPDMGNRLHAILELAPDAAFPADGMAFVMPALTKLSALKRPRSVEFTRSRIRDDAGKVRRSALREARLGKGA